MALPCLGYLFETDSVCMCCTSCLYPLIRDRCGPLGSHQESKKLHPPSYFPPRFSLALFSLPRCCTAWPCFHVRCRVRATLHTVAKEQNGNVCRAQKRASRPTTWRNRHRDEGVFSIKARVRGKGEIKARCGSLS